MTPEERAALWRQAFLILARAEALLLNMRKRHERFIRDEKRKHLKVISGGSRE